MLIVNHFAGFLVLFIPHFSVMRQNNALLYSAFQSELQESVLLLFMDSVFRSCPDTALMQQIGAAACVRKYQVYCRCSCCDISSCFL